MRTSPTGMIADSQNTKPVLFAKNNSNVKGTSPQQGSWDVTITSKAEADILHRFEPKQGYYSEKK